MLKAWELSIDRWLCMASLVKRRESQKVTNNITLLRITNKVFVLNFFWWFRRALTSSVDHISNLSPSKLKTAKLSSSTRYNSAKTYEHISNVAIWVHLHKRNKVHIYVHIFAGWSTSFTGGIPAVIKAIKLLKREKWKKTTCEERIDALKC